MKHLGIKGAKVHKKQAVEYLMPGLNRDLDGFEGFKEEFYLELIFYG